MDSNVDTRALWEQLLKLQADDETYGLMRSHALIALYTQLYLSRSKELAGSYHIPSYIADMKQKFDNAYDKQYSLDELSLKYNINKYRLCREFAKYYHDTPLQYYAAYLSSGNAYYFITLEPQYQVCYNRSIKLRKKGKAYYPYDRYK